MQTGSVTTPFGRRSMTLSMLASQYRSKDIAPGQAIDKWKLFRALCEAKPLLGVTDRALAVLNALLSFYPGNELSEENGLVVFPSNMQLSIRAHGIAPATLRRHLAALVGVGLLIRKDSPNGKRYARRDGDGDVNQAFGFSVAPLLSRSAEIQSLAAQVTADRALLRATRERLSLCRRDIAKLIETALEEGIAGDWSMIHDHFRSLVHRIPRSPNVAQIAPILEEMEMLREEVLNLLEIRIKAQNMNGNESQTERHIQISKPESIFDLEPASNKKQGETSEVMADSGEEAMEEGRAEGSVSYRGGLRTVRRDRPSADGPPLKSFPLGLVLQACPEIAMYGPGGSVGSWRDLMAAAVVVRSMLGVSPSAYEEACGVMGPENAATVIACVLERAGYINSAGGYLRDLTRRAERGEFAIGPMVMSLARANGGSAANTG
ncbi:plasmid replication protein RepC [Rhizobium sp. 2YAF20]|uniref:plasmid replication protein RepC n=1 Tax=Rhizobium sp. 2YAF20 TaxID=3233027 RepID=UPI003F9B3E15